MDARAAADALQHWAEWHEALDAAVAAGDDELAWQLRTGHESVQEAAPRQLRTDAELDAVEAAIEAREAAIEAREERRVLFDVLQPGWSDACRWSHACICAHRAAAQAQSCVRARAGCREATGRAREMQSC